jgi:VanZ family protein
MGKRHVRVIRIRKWLTASLLVIVSVAIAALLFYLSGKAYAKDAHPVREILASVLRRSQPPSRDAILASLMPIIANALLFVPWGFLCFLTIDSPQRRRIVTYAITFLSGLVFALAMIAWQAWLPTRVTGYADAVFNALGAVAGAIGGHLRKNVHVEFEF